MKNTFQVNGVPVTINFNKEKIKNIFIGNSYLIEPCLDETYEVIFLAKGDNGRYKSSNVYSQKYNFKDDLDEIINGIANEGYFPEFEEWIRLNRYIPDKSKPILERIWTFRYQIKNDKLNHQKHIAWEKEVESFVKNLTIKEKSIFRELQDPAYEILSIMNETIKRVEGIDCNSNDIPIDILSKEEYLLCMFFMHISNEISISNDGFLIDPEWEDPIPRGSCYLEDII